MKTQHWPKKKEERKHYPKKWLAILKKKKEYPSHSFQQIPKESEILTKKKKKKVIYETPRMKYNFFIILKRVGSLGSWLKSQNVYEQKNKVRR